MIYYKNVIYIVELQLKINGIKIKFYSSDLFTKILLILFMICMFTTDMVSKISDITPLNKRKKYIIFSHINLAVTKCATNFLLLGNIDVLTL